MTIIARAMVRTKSDSYCQAHDLETTGIRRIDPEARRLRGDWVTAL